MVVYVAVVVDEGCWCAVGGYDYDFFVTYGFVGLEYVSFELDDPFGDDDNDFDNLGMAQRVYEVRLFYVYVCIYIYIYTYVRSNCVFVGC